MIKLPSMDGTQGNVTKVAVTQSFAVMVSTGSCRKQSRMASSFGHPTAAKNCSARLKTRQTLKTLLIYRYQSV